MHEMQTIVTDVCSVCQSFQSISQPVSLSVTPLNSVAHAVCTGSFSAAFVTVPRPLIVLRLMFF